MCSSDLSPVPRPSSAVICGDLNLLPDDAQYQLLFQDTFVNAWRHLRRGEPDPATTGLHDRTQWPMGGHCRDYFAVTHDVARRIRAVDIDTTTDASDHQPLKLVLAD